MATLTGYAAAPIHPGEILTEDLLTPLGITQQHLSEATGLPSPQVCALAQRKCRVTADIAARLASYFGTTQDFWLDLQEAFDIESQSSSCRC